ncbi:MAG: hypothetical protein ACRDZ4_13850 [Egibacteraceae bacterium]
MTDAGLTEHVDELCLTAGEVEELCRLLARSARSLADGEGQVGHCASLLAAVSERLREQQWEQSRCARAGGSTGPSAQNVSSLLGELIGCAAQTAVAADPEQTVIVVYALAHLAELVERAIRKQIDAAVDRGVGWDELGAAFGLTGLQARHRWDGHDE